MTEMPGGDKQMIYRETIPANPCGNDFEGDETFETKLSRLFPSTPEGLEWALRKAQDGGIVWQRVATSTHTTEIIEWAKMPQILKDYFSKVRCAWHGMAWVANNGSSLHPVTHSHSQLEALLVACKPATTFAVKKTTPKPCTANHSLLCICDPRGARTNTFLEGCRGVQGTGVLLDAY